VGRIRLEFGVDWRIVKGKRGGGLKNGRGGYLENYVYFWVSFLF
jgi:hypothetical protein